MSLSRRSLGSALLGALPLAAIRPRPKLLVLIAAEQFRSDYLDRNDGALSKGGFRRLLEEGSYFPDCRMRASSFTSSGLATLATGAWPQTHGIVADTWFDSGKRKVVRAAAEATVGTTLVQQVTADPHSRVFSLGIDQASAPLLCGRTTAPAFSIDALGEFTVRGAEPAWFAAWRRQRPVEKYRNVEWMALGARQGSLPLRVLKYDPARVRDFIVLYKASPYALGAQFELARELIAREKLGENSGLDMVALSVGSPALLGYDAGGDSVLMDQMVLHLDREIERTLEFLLNTPGPGNFDLVFTAAHGAPAEPPADQRATLAIAGETVARALQDAIAAQFKNVALERYVYPFVYLKIDAPGQAPRREIREAVGRLAMQAPGVAGYFTADGDCSHGGEWLQRFRNSFHALRSGDLMLSYAPGVVEDYGAGRGVSYGSLYNYDCRVPLVFYGAQFRAQVFEYPVETVDVAPTLARAAGLPYPSSSTGRVLGEVFAPVMRPLR